MTRSLTDLFRGLPTHLTVDQLAHVFTVYPSMSGSIAEAARRMHHSPLD